MRNSIFKSYTKKILRSEAFISLMIVFVLALGIIGTSYALYMDVDTDTNYQLVEVGDLSIGFDNGENTITLENMTPMEDEIALKESGNIFSFYIYNTGTYNTDYEIKLIPDNTNGNTIAPEFINYQICKDNSENCTDIKTLGENSLIYTDALSPKKETDASNPSAYYFLRLWINNQYTETSGGTIKYNVEISAKNSSGYLDNKNTLAGAILNNPNITINNTVPIFNGIADYKVTGDATSGELGLFKAEDDYGTSYYFRGAQSNNYVNFAGFTWRVVRINGDGSVRLILEGTLDKVKREGLDTYAGTTSEFNLQNNDNAYAGYMFGLAGTTTDSNRCLMLIDNVVVDKISDYSTQDSCETNGGKWTTTAYEATHANVASSTIKTKIDLFYETYIENDNYHYEKYLADSIFCNDKSLIATQKNLSIHGIGSNPTYYSTSERIYFDVKNNGGSDTLLTKKIIFPSLKCAENELSDFSRLTSKIDMTVSLPNGVKINNDLEHPISLLSADELAFAGLIPTKKNLNFYFSDAYKNGLSSDIWWFNSPLMYLHNSNISQIGSIYFRADTGGFGFNAVSSNYGVRPVINLRKDVLISGGNGTKTTPYTINYN